MRLAFKIALVKNTGDIFYIFFKFLEYILYLYGCMYLCIVHKS